MCVCVCFNQPRDVLCGAADEVLATLKSDHMKEKEKKKEISSLLGSLDDEQFAMLSGLGRRVTDYGADKHAAVESKCPKCVMLRTWSNMFPLVSIAIHVIGMYILELG